jgi:tellurite resistance protein
VRAFADRRIPLASFAPVMGIAGLGIVWHARWIVAFAAAICAVLLVAWIIRIFTQPHELADELRGAITASYFGAITISCNLVAAGMVEWAPTFALLLWIVGALGSLTLVLYLTGRWIQFGISDFELTPSLFLPGVGNATSVYAAVGLGHSELGWLSLGIAVAYWLTILPIVTYRLLVVQPRLPRKMAPQLGIYVAAPAVIASAWFSLSGRADGFFLIVAFTALFFALLVVRLSPMVWGEPFNVATWGYTFPAAALALAFAHAAHALPTPLYTGIAFVTLWVATIIVAACTVWTLMGWAHDLAKSVSSADSSRSSPAD